MVNKIVNEYEPEAVSHPGETLKDLLDELNMSQSELASRTGRPIKTINEIYNGKSGITPETAIQFERVLGVPASFWNNRQRIYEECIVRHAEENRLKKSLEWLRRFPLKDMIDLNYIEGSKDKLTILKRVLNFLGVVSPQIFEQQRTKFAIQYRKSDAFEADEYALAAWLRRGRNLADQIPCTPYDREAFRNSLCDLRKLTTEAPDTFVPKLQDKCANLGVAVVFVPELPKIRAFGASYWIANKAVIQLSLRGKKDDTLWFTFFHEAGHIVLHERKRSIFLDAAEKKGKEENEASRFASELLIHKRDLNSFVNKQSRLTYQSIVRFAEEQGIAPSIVVGQLHHFKYAPFTHFQKLRRTLAWDM